MVAKETAAEAWKLAMARVAPWGSEHAALAAATVLAAHEPAVDAAAAAAEDFRGALVAAAVTWKTWMASEVMRDLAGMAKAAPGGLEEPAVLVVQGGQVVVVAAAAGSVVAAAEVAWAASGAGLGWAAVVGWAAAGMGS